MPAKRELTYAYFDAHTHLDGETEEFFSMLDARGMAVAASLSWPCAFPQSVSDHAGSDHVFFTVGIHPWNADRADFSEMERAFAEMIAEMMQEGVSLPAGTGLRRAPRRIRAIGEIGMDSVWRDIPLDVQRRLFLRQLDWAEEVGLPVVLHTKGCEEEIAELLRPYSGPFLLHWYSCPVIFSAYREKDCFFTVGPDVTTNGAVQNVIRTVPMDRLMVETDGRDAVEWATGTRVAEARIPDILDGLTERVAALKNLPRQDVRRAVVRNALRFYNIRGEA
jgi:TatD DNase family protein